MPKTVIKLNSDGIRELLRSAEMEAICKEYAGAIHGRCGSGYATDSYRGKNRVNAMVWAETSAAKADNSKNNTILKAIK